VPGTGVFARQQLQVSEFDLRDAVDGVAGLTAVDGATVITERYEVNRLWCQNRAPRPGRIFQTLVATPVARNRIACRYHAGSLGPDRLEASRLGH
jgi:hypothetical protein